MIVSLIIFILYTIYCLTIRAKSYSASYYSLKHKIFFIIFTWGIALSLIYSIQDMTLAYSCIGLVIVGITGAIKGIDPLDGEDDKTTKIAHWIGVSIAVVFSQVYIADLSYILITGFGCLLSLLLKNKLFWMEFCLFSVLFLYLITK